MSGATASTESWYFATVTHENVEMRLWADGSITFTSDSGDERFPSICNPGRNETIDNGDGGTPHDFERFYDFDCEQESHSPAIGWTEGGNFFVATYAFSHIDQELSDIPIYTTVFTRHPLAK